MILEHAEWILFCWIVANQGGVPAPAVPALLAVGTLAASGRVRVGSMIAAAVAATLCADLGWYGLGRWRGTSVLTGLGRLSPKADALVRRGQAAFCSHRAMFRMSARMLPEMNPVAAGLAGATGQGLASFLGYGMASAMIWVGVWIGLGYLLGDALMEFAARYAIRLPEFLIAA